MHTRNALTMISMNEDKDKRFGRKTSTLKAAGLCTLRLSAFQWAGTQSTFTIGFQ